MGMSASQARLLSLTARLSDLEFQAQAIGNSKIRLADEGSTASRKYAEALDKKIMKVKDGTGNYEDARIDNIALYGKAQDLNSTDAKLRYIEDGAGKLVMTQAQRNQLTGTFPGGLPTTISNNIPRLKNADGTPSAQFDTNSAAYKYYQDIYAKLAANPSQVTIISADNGRDPEWLESQIQSGNIYLREFDEDEKSFEQVSWTSGDSKLSEQDDKTGIARAEAEYNTTMADIQSKDKRFDMQLKTIDTEHQAIQTEIDSVKKVISKNIERSFKIFDA